MRPFLPLIISGVLPAAQAFQFTGPDSSNKINITQPVEITWTLDSTFQEPLARSFRLWFYAVIGDGPTTASWEIRSNISLSSRSSFTWDPSDIVGLIMDNDNNVKPGKLHYFAAKLIGADGSNLATVESEKYALEGYDFIRNGGGRIGVQCCTPIK